MAKSAKSISTTSATTRLATPRQARRLLATTGVPAMIGSLMVAKGIWSGKGVFNMENFDAKPFMDELNKQGLPWEVIEMKPGERYEV